MGHPNRYPLAYGVGIYPEYLDFVGISASLTYRPGTHPTDLSSCGVGGIGGLIVGFLPLNYSHFPPLKSPLRAKNRRPRPILPAGTYVHSRETEEAGFKKRYIILSK